MDILTRWGHIFNGVFGPTGMDLAIGCELGRRYAFINVLRNGARGSTEGEVNRMIDELQKSCDELEVLRAIVPDEKNWHI